MIKYEYKKQGDGRDSWIAIETDSDGKEITRYMVYEDPNTRINLSNIDITTLTDEQVQQLKTRLGL